MVLIHSTLFFLLGSHLSAETSTMTDSERDQIDEEAEKVIHMCQTSVALIKSRSLRQMSYSPLI